MSRRGDIIRAEIPFHDRPGSKERPVVVVQCDRNNTRLMSTVVAGIRKISPSHYGADAVPCGFHRLQRAPLLAFPVPSAVKCENLYTVSQTRIKKTPGHLSDPLKKKLADCLKAALEIS